MRFQEPNQIHLCAIEDNSKVVGICILVPPADKSKTDAIKMRQVAVAPSHQRRGVGRQVCFISIDFSLILPALREKTHTGKSFSFVFLKLMNAAAAEAKRLGFDFNSNFSFCSISLSLFFCIKFNLILFSLEDILPFFSLTTVFKF